MPNELAKGEVMDKPKPKTMNDLYGDGSDHECCQRCGFCKWCGDCKESGCGHKPPQTNPTFDELAKRRGK